MTSNCIISVSIPKEQKKWLEETATSPSKLLQDSIKNAMALSLGYENLIKKQQHLSSLLEKEIQAYNRFLDSQGISESWLKWRGANGTS